MDTQYIVYRDGERIANKKALDKCRRYFQRKGKSYEDFFIYVFKKVINKEIERRNSLARLNHIIYPYDFEIENKDEEKVSIPRIYSFERLKICEMQPVQGEIIIPKPLI